MKIFVAEVFDKDSNKWVFSQAFEHKDDCLDYIDFQHQGDDDSEYQIVEREVKIKEESQ